MPPVIVKGTTALVTGAARGIGAAFVEALVARGARKVYAGVRRLEDGRVLERRFPGVVSALRLDVTRENDPRDAAAAAPDVDLLINNAGTANAAPILEAQAVDAARADFETNVVGLLRTTQAFAPVLARNGGGAVVNLASVAAYVNFPVLPTYSVSKAAVHSLTQALRMQLHARGTRVLAVYPGPVDTRMAESLPFEKVSPSIVANAALDGLEAGLEEVHPDSMSTQLAAAYYRDPKALERQIASGS